MASADNPIDISQSEEKASQYEAPVIDLVESGNDEMEEEPALTAEEKRKEEQRARRKRLNELLRPGVIPSFTDIISPNIGGNNKKPKWICIDVDEYLGLKGDSPIPQDTSSLYVPGSTRPEDEGYFQGVVPMTLPDDSRYLSEFHQLIRGQLELFSATDEDLQTTQAGRRTPTVRGKVGVRCVHCSRELSKAPVSARSWPPGSVSYPVNIAGIYPVSSQKPALHFESCPYLPPEIKAHLYRITHDSGGQSSRRQKEGGTRSNMSAVTYYAVAAKRIGLIDVDGGMRFGRDLSLEPLSVESVRAQVEEAGSTYRRTGGLATPSRVASAAPTTPRITADEESEGVLAEAIAEKDSEDILGRSDDNKLVTDFMFLCVRQMAVCRAVPSDFATRGKKTRMMRLGFAGFCCRYCHVVNNPEKSNVAVDYSCRSFASAPDNLASAISNSFYVHLQKCHLVPVKIRKALAAYKRIHGRQIVRLPHGSQRRLFHALWHRLRAADISEEAMKAQMEKVAREAPAPVVSSASVVVQPAPAVPQQVVSGGSVPDSVTSGASTDGRPPGFPTCDDQETQRVFTAALEHTNYAENDNLILPSDFNLVSDYVFLMMKQLRVALPGPMDFARGRRSTVLNTRQAGLGCRHCCDKDQGSAGRSFPSQPDNMASSLNTSLYQHFQRCPFVQPDIKRALSNLKKLHSLQCSNLKFGSQRKYFNLVFQRLRKVVVDDFDPNAGRPVAGGPSKDPAVSSDFMLVAGTVFQCCKCRMVPVALRASSSVLTKNDSDAMSKHRQLCKGESFDLGAVVAVLKKIESSCGGINRQAFLSDSFKAVVSELLGGQKDLVEIFTTDAVKLLDNAPPPQSMEKKMSPSGLWNAFPTTVDSTRVEVLFRAFAESVEGLEDNLRACPDFVRYFQFVSPAFGLSDAAAPTATEGGDA